MNPLLCCWTSFVLLLIKINTRLKTGYSARTARRHKKENALHAGQSKLYRSLNRCAVSFFSCDTCLKHLEQRFKRRRTPAVLWSRLGSRKYNICIIKLGRCWDTGTIFKRLRRLCLQSLLPDVTLISFAGRTGAQNLNLLFHDTFSNSFCHFTHFLFGLLHNLNCQKPFHKCFSFS